MSPKKKKKEPKSDFINKKSLHMSKDYVARAVQVGLKAKLGL